MLVFLVKDMNLRALEKLPLRNLLFSYLKFLSLGIRCTVTMLDDFTKEGSSGHKNAKNICLDIYNSRVKDKILTK